MKNLLIVSLAVAIIALLSFNDKRTSDTRYVVATGATTTALASEVNGYLANGWQLVGDVSYGNGQFVQALIKK